MGLHGKSSRKKSECERNVVSKLLELSYSRNFRKFETMYDINRTKKDDKNLLDFYQKDELNLYKEEVLYDFSTLSKKSTIISLC